MKENVRRIGRRDDRPTSFRSFLQEELARRCAGNSQYSLRAFAMHLDVDHSTLSQLLRARRRFTEARIRDLGARLGLPAVEIERYVAGEDGVADVGGSGATSEIRRLARDTASVLSDWHHYAILELVRLDSFRPDVGWISRVLGIAADDVNISLQRLCHLGLLRMEGDTWTDLCGHASAGFDGFQETTLRRLFEQTRKLAIAAVEESPTSIQEHTSTTVAIDSSRLPAAIERIARLRRDIIEFLEQDGDRDAVYQLEISLFPLTRIPNRSTAPEEESDHGKPGPSLADRDPES